MLWTCSGLPCLPLRIFCCPLGQAMPLFTSPVVFSVSHGGRDWARHGPHVIAIERPDWSPEVANRGWISSQMGGATSSWHLFFWYTGHKGSLQGDDITIISTLSTHFSVLHLTASAPCKETCFSSIPHSASLTTQILSLLLEISLAVPRIR
jgi:hypothetical protein